MWLKAMNHRHTILTRYEKHNESKSKRVQRGRTTMISCKICVYGKVIIVEIESKMVLEYYKGVVESS